MGETARDVHFTAMAANVTLDALNGPAIEAAKRSILDTVSVAVAASSVEPAVRALLGFVDDGVGGEASVWGLGRRVPAANTAFADGALDFDERTPASRRASGTLDSNTGGNDA